jgi:hypothetical protein
MEPRVYPQDGFIQQCRENIERLTAEHKAKLEERQKAEREARAMLREIESYKEELRLHLSNKMEQIERESSRQHMTPAIAAPLPPNGAQLLPVLQETKKATRKRVDKKK